MAFKICALSFLALLTFDPTSALSKSLSSITYESPELWQAWKTEHGKNYSSQLEELDRHLVWLSNKKYIEAHNSYDHVFGYMLKLNQFADMVSSNV